MAGHAATSARTSFSFYRTLTSQFSGFLETLKNPANLFQNNLNNTSNNMKAQIKKKNNKKKTTKKNGGIVELLIPTLKKLIRNQDTYFVVIINNQNNQCTCSPLKYGSSFLKKKSFS